MIDKILTNIIEIRKQKGFSLEVMAMDLDISVAAYRKIEMKLTKLSVEKLFKIAEILQTDVATFLEIKSKTELHQTNKDSSTGYLQQIENFHQENKERSEKIEQLYEARLADKKIIIDNLTMQLQNLTRAK